MSDATQIAQVAIATGQQREQCPICRRWGPWEIPTNGIGLVCGFCGAWCLVGGRK